MKKEVSELDLFIYEILKHRSAENKIKDPEVRGLVDYRISAEKIKSTDVRKSVNNLRQNGYPICSDSGGYWIARSKDELLDNAGRLRSRAIKIMEDVKGMNKAVEKFETMQKKLNI